MHRFIIKNEYIQNGRAPLSQEETAHALRVLRLRDGCAVQAIDDAGGAWDAILRIGESGDAWVELTESTDTAEADIRLTLYMGIPKGDKLDFIAQKLTELGANNLTPVRMERCVAKIVDSDVSKKLERLSRLSREAQKQCGRARELEISKPLSVLKAAEELKDYDLVLILWEEAEGYRLKDAFRDCANARNIAFVVGAEGGISRSEIEQLCTSGAKTVTLGPRILRAETAAVAGCSIIMSLWGDI